MDLGQAIARAHLSAARAGGGLLRPAAGSGFALGRHAPRFARFQFPCHWCKYSSGLRNQRGIISVVPIRPEFRKFYGAAWRHQIRPRILERAGNCCEQCGKPAHATVWVYSAGEPGQYWHPVPLSLDVDKQCWTSCVRGAFGDREAFMLDARQVSRAQRTRQLRKIKVVIAVAHLNHVAGDDRDENLRALCCWCHLHLDQGQHKEARQVRKDRARPLLAAVAAS